MEKQKRNEKKLLCCFGITLFLFLGAAALTVFLTDPFFHYHKPWFGLPAVQDNHQYQIPGALAHLDYDSLLVGSSVSMSINTGTLDAKFGSRTIKAVENTAPASTLKYYIESALENRSLKYIFYGMDVFSFYCWPGEVPQGSAQTAYLTNDNPFDDVNYLWNGEVLMKRVPDLLKISRDGGYDEGMAYQFNRHKNCGPEYVLPGYDPNESLFFPGSYEESWKRENLEQLERLVRENPQTEFVFFIPAYSVLWWYASHNVGMFYDYMDTLKLSMQTLLAYDNVRMYATDFNASSVITDLYLYTDKIHGGSDVTELMADAIGEAAQEITLDNYEAQVDKLTEAVERFKEKYETEGDAFLYLPGGMQM